MLTERSLGPRAVAVDAVTVAAIPESAVEPAFASRQGARFLAVQGAAARGRGSACPPTASSTRSSRPAPLEVDADDPVGEVAAAMTRRGAGYAVVPLEDGRFGLVTDALLRSRVLVEGRQASVPAREVMDDVGARPSCSASPRPRRSSSCSTATPSTCVVTDRGGRLHGVITPRDFTVSAEPRRGSRCTSRSAGRPRSRSCGAGRAGRPPCVDDLLSVGHGLRQGHRGVLVDPRHDRAADDHPDVRAVPRPVARRLHVAVAGQQRSSGGRAQLRHRLRGRLPGRLRRRRRSTATGPLSPTSSDELAAAGITADSHGATASRPAFSRTNAEWRAAARQWMAEPVQNQGAMMTSLLVDGRPIHGDPGLPEVMKVFSDLRRHPGTMRLLLEESLVRAGQDALAPRSRGPPRHHQPQEARGAADRQHGPVGGAGRRLVRAVDRRTAAGGRRVGDAARRAGAQPDRRVHGPAAAPAALPAASSTSAARSPSTWSAGNGCRPSTAAWSRRPSGRSPPSSGAWTTSPPTCPPRRGRGPRRADRQTTSSVLPNTERSLDRGVRAVGLRERERLADHRAEAPPAAAANRLLGEAAALGRRELRIPDPAER